MLPYEWGLNSRQARCACVVVLRDGFSDFMPLAKLVATVVILVLYLDTLRCTEYNLPNCENDR